MNKPEVLRFNKVEYSSDELKELGLRLSEEIEGSIAYAQDRNYRLQDIERQYLVEKDPTFRGPYGDSMQFQVPAMRWIIDSTASVMSDAMLGADPLWVVKYSVLRQEDRSAVEDDLGTIADLSGFTSEIDKAITYSLLDGTSILEVFDENKYSVIPDPQQGIGGDLSMDEVALIVDPRAERFAPGLIRVWHRGGPRVVAHRQSNCFVVPYHEDNLDNARAVGVYIQMRQSEVLERQDEFPGWDQEVMSPGSATTDMTSNDLVDESKLGMTRQDLRDDERTHEFFRGVVRAKVKSLYGGWHDYEFVLHRQSRRFVSFKPCTETHGLRPFVAVTPIPREGSWQGTGVGELISPLSKACSMLLSMYIDTIRIGIAPPIRIDPMSLDLLRGQEIGAGKFVPADDAAAIIQGLNTFDVVNAMRMLREFMDLIVGSGTQSYGVQGPSSASATSSAIVDRRSSLRGNKLLHRIQESVCRVAELFRHSLFANYECLSRLAPLRIDNPAVYLMPMILKGNGQSIYSTSEYRQQILMAFYDRLIQFPVIQQMPQAAMRLIELMADAMELPSSQSFIESLNEAAAQMPPGGMGMGGEAPGPAGSAPAMTEGASMTPPSGGA